MSSDSDEWRAQALAAIRLDRIAAVRDAAFALQMVGLVGGSIPDTHFRVLIELLGHPDLIRASHASKFVMVVQFVWDMLSDEQRTELLRAIEPLFGVHKDWAVASVFADLVTWKCEGPEAVSFLERLCRVPGEEGRIVVAGELGRVASRSRDRRVRERVRECLLALQKDPSSEVRSEATAQLRSLARDAE